MRVLFYIVVALIAVAVAYVFADHAFPQPMSKAALGLQRWLGGLTRKTVEIPGFTISYLDGGVGEPLVLVHGIGADKDNWGPIAPFLRGLGRIVAPDLPGFGESSKPLEADYSIEAQAERLGQFLDQLGLARAHLGGNSMGGAVILEFAHLHPERVLSLWLLDPAGVESAKESEMIRAYRDSGQMRLFSKTQDDFDKVMHLAMSRPPPLPYSVRHELALAAVANYPLHTRIFRELADRMPALERQTAGLQTPALIVWGRQDRVLDVSGAEILHQALPNSQLVIMPGIGHLPMLEAPLQTARDYKSFRQHLPLPGAAAEHTP